VPSAGRSLAGFTEQTCPAGPQRVSGAFWLVLRAGFVISSRERKELRTMWRCVIAFLTACVVLVGALGCSGGDVSNDPRGPEGKKVPGGTKNVKKDKSGGTNFNSE
jgi:hypothetical protein